MNLKIVIIIMLAVMNVIINYNKTLSLFNKPQTNKHEQKSASPPVAHISAC